MSLKLIIRELAVWIVSIGIAYVIWYPIFSKISFLHQFFGIFSIVMMIQFFRWFVFYDQVIIFKRGYHKAFFILIIFAIGAITWSKGQEILLIAENQALEDIAKTSVEKLKVELSMQESYNLFAYLRNLLVLCNFGTPGLAFMLILKIIYKTIGMGNQRVKSYLGK